MATIAMFPWPEGGHGQPFARLARLLQSRHRVIVCSHMDVSRFYHCRGIEFSGLCPDLLEENTYAWPQQGDPENKPDQAWKARRKRAWNRFFAALEQRSLTDLVGTRPDIALVDVAWPYYSLMALRDGISSAAISPAVPLEWDSETPPACTTLMPDSGFLGRMQREAAWTYVMARKKLRFWRGRLRHSHHEIQYLPKWADSAGVPPDHFEKRNSEGRPWTLRHQELVMCPQIFDFPRPIPAWRHYLEAGIDTARLREKSPAWIMELPKDRPLVYCALGSQAHTFNSGRLFLQKVVEAARLAPEFHFLIARGSRRRWNSFSSLPANVTVVDYAPQLQILERAALMITHGGLGSVKECIWSGVPMIVFPFICDQPGNAARVSYHGLGLQGDPNTVSVSEIHGMVRSILNDPSFTKRIRSMQSAFRHLEAECPSIRLIDGLVERATRAKAEAVGLRAGFSPTL